MMKQIIISNWIKDLPKVEIHCHFEGSIRIETIYELSKKNNIIFPGKTLKEFKKKLIYKNQQNPTLRKYLDNIKLYMSVLTTLESFERVAFEICEDCYKENIMYLELRFTPTHNISKALDPNQVVHAVLKGMERAKNQYGILSGLIISGVRKNIDVTQKAIDVAVKYKNKGVVGFDIAGRGNENKCSDYKELISEIYTNNIPITIHVGESDGCEGIKEALKYLKANRIGHGVALRENVLLMDRIVKNKIPIECCLTSNIDTGVVEKIENHPIKLFFSKGVICSIGVDNRTISNTTLSQELLLLNEKLGFSIEDICQIMKNNIKISFMSELNKDKLYNELEEYIQKMKIKSFK